MLAIPFGPLSGALLFSQPLSRSSHTVSCSSSRSAIVLRGQFAFRTPAPDLVKCCCFLNSHGSHLRIQRHYIAVTLSILARTAHMRVLAVSRRPDQLDALKALATRTACLASIRQVRRAPTTRGTRCWQRDLSRMRQAASLRDAEARCLPVLHALTFADNLFSALVQTSVPLAFATLCPRGVFEQAPPARASYPDA